MKAILASASLVLLAALFAARPIHAQEDEIVANLAGGRTIIQVANDAILFASIDHPLESKSVPPRVAAIDSRHVGIFFGASEWQVPAQPKPIRLDRDIPRLGAPDAHYARSDVDQDLEQVGVAFLERLRPLVAQLHHKIDLKPDEPLFEIILIGYAPQDYGPEVWLIDFNVEQAPMPTQADFWQTHILRPRFTQLYPPEKHQPKVPLDIRFPANLPGGVPLLGLIQQNDPLIARLRSSDPHINKIVEQMEHGETQKTDPTASENFLRAVLPQIAGQSDFIMGKVGENSGFEWIVPPAEPQVKEKTAEDKNRPADAPTLMRKPKP